MKLLIPFVSLTAWVMIEIMVLLNPTATLAAANLKIDGIVFFLFSPLLFFFAPFFALRTQTRTKFFLLFAGGFLFMLAAAWLAAYCYHRDFFSFHAQAIILYCALFLSRLDGLELIRRKKVVYASLATAANILFILWIGWIMLMSYAIVVRAEPRWIESIGYNLTGGIAGIVLLLSGGLLRESGKHRIYLTQEAIYLDSRNISTLLTRQEERLIQVFLNSGMKAHTCSDLLAILYQPDDGVQEVVHDCERCLAELWTAYACPAYRNIKNRINDIKKYLELLQIGTIVPVAENPKLIKEKGWRLRLFDDVLLSSHQPPVAG